MSLWDDFVEQVRPAVEEASDNFIKIGVPAIKASVAQQAIGWLEEQKLATQKELNQNVRELAAESSDPNSLGSQLAGVFQTTALNNYGLYIIAAVAGILVAGALLKGK